MLLTPKIFTGCGINHSQICIAGTRFFIVDRNRVFLNMSLTVDATSLPSRHDDISSLIRISGWEEYQVRLLSVWNDLKLPPLLQLSKGTAPHRIGPSLIVKVDCLSRHDSR